MCPLGVPLDPRITKMEPQGLKMNHLVERKQMLKVSRVQHTNYKFRQMCSLLLRSLWLAKQAKQVGKQAMRVLPITETTHNTGLSIRRVEDMISTP